MQERPVADPNQIHFAWLVRVRWCAIAGQLATMLGVRFGMHLALPLLPLLVVVAAEAFGNALCAARARSAASVPMRWLGFAVAADILALTALLYFSGGPLNPFSFLYLVPLALAALMLPPVWTWALVMWSLAGSALLFTTHEPLPLGSSHAEHMAMHLRGMWVALGVAAAFIVYFLARVRRALAERDAELAASRSLAARQEKLSSLVTLAAGAAHELNTPLSTIALVATELERGLARGADAAKILDDARLVRAEVERCRGILERMSADAGEALGEELVALDLGHLVETSLVGLPARPAVRVERACDARRPRLPAHALAQVMRNLVQNAQHASRDDAEVRVSVRSSATDVEVEIADRGAGMTPEVLARAGEPFFTTKPVGRGMGLGLFLARTVVERLGGRLNVTSRVGEGTVVRVWLPQTAAPLP